MYVMNTTHAVKAKLLKVNIQGNEGVLKVYSGGAMKKTEFVSCNTSRVNSEIRLNSSALSK